ncbi:hypothetical protein [Shewanella woodyi]|uniref:hypothetical protein n=1 Tax=Shewanella woodyi TaxID=60961 RepID=UPI0007F914AC|nr:hypothetical protein [Shewanella woodyi]
MRFYLIFLLVFFSNYSEAWEVVEGKDRCEIFIEWGGYIDDYLIGYKLGAVSFSDKMGNINGESLTKEHFSFSVNIINHDLVDIKVDDMGFVSRDINVIPSVYAGVFNIFEYDEVLSSLIGEELLIIYVSVNNEKINIKIDTSKYRREYSKYKSCVVEFLDS